VKESLTEKMWKSTSAKAIQKARKKRKTVIKDGKDSNTDEDDPYDDLSIDSIGSAGRAKRGRTPTVHGHISDENNTDNSHIADEEPDVNMDGLYVFNNPAMWSVGTDTDLAVTSVSMSKAEGMTSFEDAGKSTPKRRNTLKNSVQDSFANVGVNELARLRAARNRVDQLHPNEGLLGDPFAEGDDRDGSETSTIASNVSDAEPLLGISSTTALTANIALRATDVDVSNPTRMIHTAIMEQDGVNRPPPLSKSLSFTSTPTSRKELATAAASDTDSPFSSAKMAAQLSSEPSQYFMSDEDIAALKRVPPGLQAPKVKEPVPIASTSRKASIVPTVATMPEAPNEDEEGDDTERSAGGEVAKLKAPSEGDGDQSPTFVKRKDSYIASSTNMAHKDQVEAYMSLAEAIEAQPATISPSTFPQESEEHLSRPVPSQPTQAHGERKVHFDDQPMDDSVTSSDGADVHSAGLGAGGSEGSKREGDSKESDSLKIPLGHNLLDSDPLNCRVPDEDDISEITTDDRSRSNSLVFAGSIPPLIVSAVVAAEVEANLKDEEKAPDSNRSDITDSDNEAEPKNVDDGNDEDLSKPPVLSVTLQQQAHLSQVAANFRKDAQAVPRTALESSTGPIVNAHEGHIGAIEESEEAAELDLLPVDVEDVAEAHRQLHLQQQYNHQFAQGTNDGIAVLEHGEWKLLPAPSAAVGADGKGTAPAVSGHYKAQGKYFKEPHAEEKGLRTLDTSAIHPLAEVHLSTFNKMKMPNPPPIVNPERVANATKPLRGPSARTSSKKDIVSTKNEPNLEIAAVRVRAKSPPHAGPSSGGSSMLPKRTKTGSIIAKPAANSKPPTVTVARDGNNANVDTISGNQNVEFELVGKPAIPVPVENLLEDDEDLLSDHVLAEREIR
jgi:hypothetical protein